jgi:hypothetical protein
MYIPLSHKIRTSEINMPNGGVHITYQAVELNKQPPLNILLHWLYVRQKQWTSFPYKNPCLLFFIVPNMYSVCLQKYTTGTILVCIKQNRAARWYIYFHNKNINLSIFWRALGGKFWYILLLFVIFFPFWYVLQRKICQP